jgi:hypothetical protein
MFCMEWSISCSENNKNKGENPKGIVKKMDVGEVHVLSKMGWGGEWVGFVPGRMRSQAT